MSEASLRRGRITRQNIASSYPPYPSDWYIEDKEQVPDSRSSEEQEREAKLQERAAKEAALKQVEDERMLKEQALARIAQLEALLAGRA